jgi:hypothetical protein
MLQHVLTPRRIERRRSASAGSEEDAIRRALCCHRDSDPVVSSRRAPAQRCRRVRLRAGDARATGGDPAGDEPGVTCELIDRAGRARRQRRARCASGLAPAGGGVPGHPVFLARSLWPELESLRGDTGARQLFAVHPEWLHEVDVEGEPAGDVDTPEDLARAEERTALR